MNKKDREMIAAMFLTLTGLIGTAVGVESENYELEAMKYVDENIKSWVK